MSASLEQLLRDARIDLVLGRIEKDPSVINQVIAQVDNEIRSVRFNSIYILGELGPKVGEQAILKITKYLNDDDWSIRREVARSLGKIGHPFLNSPILLMRKKYPFVVQWLIHWDEFVL